MRLVVELGGRSAWKSRFTGGVLLLLLQIAGGGDWLDPLGSLMPQPSALYAYHSLEGNVLDHKCSSPFESS